MSESSEHRIMVQTMTESLYGRYQNIQIVSDIQEHPGDSLPPIIKNHRPDIYAHYENVLLICEVKTKNDIDRKRSNLQIKTFIQYLEKRHGHFILASYGQAADRAKTALRFMSESLKIKKCQLEVFDGLDYWTFKANRESPWDLI